MEDLFSKFKKITTKNTILIVDDEPDVLNLIKKFLELGKFDTITFNNTKDALNVIEKRYNDIAMVLLDPWIQKFNSDEFLQYVKSNEQYKHILVIFFSVKELPEDILKDKKWKPDGYISKPFSFRVLKKDLDKIFSLFQEQGTDKITFQRQYLPEILSPNLVEISENDGLPIIKQFAIKSFRIEGIRIIFSDTEVQFKLDAKLRLDAKVNLIKLKAEQIKTLENFLELKLEQARQEQERPLKKKIESLHIKKERITQFEIVKDKAFRLMDQAKRELRLNHFDNAIDIYREIEKIFIDMKWEEGIKMVRDSVKVITNKKKAYELEQ